MVVAQKTGWKLVCLALMAVILLRISRGQNISQISVIEEDEQKLLELLQQTNFSFEIETTVQEDDNDDQFITIPEIEELDLETPQAEIKKNFSEKIAIPESILKFADFVEQYEPPQKTDDVVSFETDLEIMRAQNMCQKDLENFRRTSFNAIGTIRISFIDGRIKYCTGTLIDSNTVITSAECYQQSAIIHLFQPSWADDTVWLHVLGIYIPDDYTSQNGTSNFALFFLQEPQNQAPTISYEIAVTQTQHCYITVLGWKFSILKKEYKMVPCPNLPDVEEQLGIESKNCGEILCNLDEMDFQTGSPIILTCPNPIQHAVIGLLREDDESKSSLPFARKTYGFPYMFNLEDYLDIKDKVKTP